jgi:hypothetical protein
MFLVSILRYGLFERMPTMERNVMASAIDVEQPLIYGSETVGTESEADLLNSSLIPTSSGTDLSTICFPYV